MAAKTRPTMKPAEKPRSAKQTTDAMKASKKPTMKEMILNIVRDVQQPKSRKGISYPIIKKELKRRHGIDTNDNKHLLHIKKTLLSALASEELTKTSGVGISGSFRMPAEQYNKMAEQPAIMTKTLVNVAKVKKTLAKKKRAAKEPKTMTPKKSAPKPKTPKKAAPKQAAAKPTPMTPKRAAPKPRTMTVKPSKKIPAKVAVTKAPPKKVAVTKAPAKKAKEKKDAPKKEEQQAEQQEDAEESHSGSESGSDHDETPAEEQTLPKPTIDEESIESIDVESVDVESVASESEGEEMDPIATPLPTVEGGSSRDVFTSGSEDDEMGPPAPKNAKSAAEKENVTKRATTAVVKKPSANPLKSSGQVEGAEAGQEKPGSSNMRARKNKASSVDESEPASKKDQAYGSKTRKASQL